MFRKRTVFYRNQGNKKPGGTMQGGHCRSLVFSGCCNRYGHCSAGFWCSAADHCHSVHVIAPWWRSWQWYRWLSCNLLIRLCCQAAPIFSGPKTIAWNIGLAWNNFRLSVAKSNLLLYACQTSCATVVTGEHMLLNCRRIDSQIPGLCF